MAARLTRTSGAGEQPLTFIRTYLGRVINHLGWTNLQVIEWILSNLTDLAAFKRDALEHKQNCSRLLHFLGPESEWEDCLRKLKGRCKENLVDVISEELDVVEIMAKTAVLIANTSFQNHMWDWLKTDLGTKASDMGKEYALRLLLTLIYDISTNPIAGFFQEYLAGNVVRLPLAGPVDTNGQDPFTARKPMPKLRLKAARKVPLSDTNALLPVAQATAKNDESGEATRDTAEDAQDVSNPRQELDNLHFQELQRLRKENATGKTRAEEAEDRERVIMTALRDLQNESEQKDFQHEQTLMEKQADHEKTKAELQQEKAGHEQARAKIEELEARLANASLSTVVESEGTKQEATAPSDAVQERKTVGENTASHSAAKIQDPKGKAPALQNGLQAAENEDRGGVAIAPAAQKQKKSVT